MTLERLRAGFFRFVARRRLRREMASARTLAATADVTIVVVGQVEAGTVDADTNETGEDVRIPFTFVVAAPRPSAFVMQGLAAEAASDALRAWFAAHAGTRYVLSAAWSATTESVRPLGLEVARSDTDYWQSDETLDTSIDPMLNRPYRGGHVARARTPFQRLGVKGRRAWTRGWPVTRISTRKGTGRQRNRGTVDEWM